MIRFIKQRNIMKKLMAVCLVLVSSLMSANSIAGDKAQLSVTQLKQKIVEINRAQNKVLMHNSSVKDADDLFSLYTDDFVYIHEVYGGEYTRKHLYRNTVKYLKSGGYNRVDDRYTIVNMMTGLNAIAVLREEQDGDRHLAVFEFNGDKVSKITEYWK